MSQLSRYFYEKTCEICSEIYRCGNKKQRTCGKKCMGLLRTKQRAVTCVCEQCKKQFQIMPGEVKCGRGKFCSKDCFHIHDRRIVTAEEINQINAEWSKGISCKQIARKLNMSPNTLKKWLITQGVYEPRRKGRNHGRCKNIACSRTVRAEIIARANNQCERCGYNAYTAILQVHHKDRNRTNNDVANLILLCPNCHEIDHWLHKDGRYGDNRRRKNLR